MVVTQARSKEVAQTGSEAFVINRSATSVDDGKFFMERRHAHENAKHMQIGRHPRARKLCHEFRVMRISHMHHVHIRALCVIAVIVIIVIVVVRVNCPLTRRMAAQHHGCNLAHASCSDQCINQRMSTPTHAVTPLCQCKGSNVTLCMLRCIDSITPDEHHTWCRFLLSTIHAPHEGRCSCLDECIP